MPKLNSEDIVDLKTLFQYTFDWQDDIYLRGQRDGKWGPVSFADATSEEKARLLDGMIDLEAGTIGIPVRVLRTPQE